MKLQQRLVKLEEQQSPPMRIVLCYEGEARPVPGAGMTVIIMKPGSRP